MHVQHLNAQVVKSIALVTQCILKQISNIDYRMSEIRLLSDADFDTRQVARQRLKHTKRTRVDEYPELEKIREQAAEINNKRVLKELANKPLQPQRKQKTSHHNNNAYASTSRNNNGRFNQSA